MFFINNSNTERNLDKYDLSRFMEYNDHYDPLWSYLLNKIKNIPYVGSYCIEQEEGRAELLSYNLYGTTKFWWLLLIYNNKICPFDLKRGEYIKYPSITNIDNFYMELRELQATHFNNTRYL